MSSTRTAFLAAATAAAELLADPAVREHWYQPSALPEFTVRGLAGHLANQILALPQVLADPVPTGDPIGLLDHYARGAWIDAGLDDEVNVAIRAAGERVAAEGHAELMAKVTGVLDELRTTLPAEPADRVIHLARGPWSLRLDDYLVTRMMELVVHSDDLAFSMGRPTPVPPAQVWDPVLDLLTRLAVRRHGMVGVLRALSRVERAPASIAAF